jgi:hypothetical protein
VYFLFRGLNCELFAFPLWYPKSCSRAAPRPHDACAKFLVKINWYAGEENAEGWGWMGCSVLQTSQRPWYSIFPFLSYHTLRNAPNTSTFFRALIRELWNDDMTAEEYREEKRAYESYFAHIFQELSTIAGGGDSIIRDLTFEHVFEIVQKLKSQNWTRAELIAESHPISGVFDTAHTQTTINFAAGLLVPLNFKSVGGARRGDVVSWLEGDTLSETISKRIEKITSRPCTSPQACTSCNQSGFERYGKNFNARQLARIAGFEIIWTSNLVDHLLLQDEDDNVKVHIFHQLKVLENHLKFPE